MRNLLFILTLIILSSCSKEQEDRMILPNDNQSIFRLESIEGMALDAVSNLNLYVFDKEVFYQKILDIKLGSDGTFKIPIPKTASLYFTANITEPSFFANLVVGQSTLSDFLTQGVTTYTAHSGNKAPEFMTYSFVPIPSDITSDNTRSIKLERSVGRLDFDMSSDPLIRINRIIIENVAVNSQIFKGNTNTSSFVKTSYDRTYSTPIAGKQEDQFRLYESTTPVKVIVQGTFNNVPISMVGTMPSVVRNTIYTIKVVNTGSQLTYSMSTAPWLVVSPIDMPTVGTSLKVACVGDEISNSSTQLSDKNNLTAQLSYLLGNRYSVENYASDGATLIKKGMAAYTKTNKYTESKNSNPDIVVIMLGTNDTKTDDIADYEADLQALVDSYKGLSRNPRIILVKPPRCFAQGVYLRTNERIERTILPAIDAVALKNGLATVNLYSLYASKGASFFDNSIVPTPLGCRDMSDKIYTAITGYGADTALESLGLWENAALKMRPGAEFRSESAGWITGTDWYDISGEVKTILKGRKLDLLLMGSSIMQSTKGNKRVKITTTSGYSAFNSRFSSGMWETTGVSGDRTQHLLYQIHTGVYDDCTATKIVVVIGENNIVTGKQRGVDVAKGIIAVANELAKKFPASTILLYGMLPIGINTDDPNRIEYNKAHALLASTQFTSTKIVYKNLTSTFTNNDAKQSLMTTYYNADYLHPNSTGFDILAEIIKNQ